MKALFAIALFFLSLLAYTGCEQDFIETDLTGKLLTILAPADHDTVSTANPLFWWNKIEGARTYHLQIVYPDFSSPQQLVYDTVIDAVNDRFYPSLNPGNTYYWRIRPENGSSQGDWVTRSVTVDSTVSLNAQTVQITSPSTDGYSTSNTTVAFAWNNVSGATFYRVQIVNTSSSSTITTTTTTVNAFSYTLAEGSYSFSVRAENATSFSPWSARIFSVDQTAPTTPVLVHPVNDSIYATPPAFVNLDWTNATDAYNDSLYISTDSTFATGIQLAIQRSASQSYYAWNGALAATTYFWRVRSLDAAGNRSNYSIKFRFVVN